MRKHLALAALIAVALMVSGCKDTHESLTKDLIAKVKEVNTVLAGIKDEASYKAAVPKLQALDKEAEDLTKRMEKLGKPDDAEQKRVLEKHGQELMELMAKTTMERMRVEMAFGKIMK